MNLRNLFGLGIRRRLRVEVIEDFEEGIQLILQDMKPNERIAFMASVDRRYCRHCGLEHPANGWCQCDNDE
jgi:hypothetical protein